MRLSTRQLKTDICLGLSCFYQSFKLINEHESSRHVNFVFMGIVFLTPIQGICVSFILTNSIDTFQYFSKFVFIIIKVRLLKIKEGWYYTYIMKTKANFMSKFEKMGDWVSLISYQELCVFLPVVPLITLITPLTKIMKFINFYE